MFWFRFMDMHSGGGRKLDWEYIYFQAEDEQSAIDKFVDLFDRHPEYITCSCCGEDYTISFADTLEEVTEYDRSWASPTRVPISVEEYIKRSDVKVIE